MCIPELIFFDDDSHDRHSRRRGNAIRPLSAESNTPQPLLASPPFVVHVSPKIGHHHHPSIRHQPTRRSTAPLPSRGREDMEWREGSRAVRAAAQKREPEDKKRNVIEVKKEVIVESQPKATVPEVTITAATPMMGRESKPASAASKPTIVEADVTVQPPLQRTVSEPQPAQVRQAPLSASIPAPVPSPAAALAAARPPPQRQPRTSQQQQDQPYVYEHRHSSQGRRHSPSNDSISSRSLRGLKRRLSSIWAHVAGLERWAMDEDARERQARRNRERIELTSEERGRGRRPRRREDGEEWGRKSGLRMIGGRDGEGLGLHLGECKKSL